ncbi:MAG: phosphotransferase [Noviherbaspirillum sp.]
MTAALDAELEVLSEAAQELDPAAVAAMALARYGIEGSLKPLSGERDRNYLLQREGDGARHVLKVSHPRETPLVADFQTQALLHIAAADPGLPVQRIVRATDGQASFLWHAPDGAPRVVRLFSYLPGEPLPGVARTPLQRVRLAQTLARLDLALAGFDHPAGALELPWDIQRADSVRSLLRHIDDSGRRALAQGVLRHFELHTKPALPSLRRQPIHNDLNIYNVLVDAGDTDRIAAILDFGDMVRAPLINDLAVAAAYQLGTDGDPLAEVLPFVAAYHAVLPLSPQELDVLFSLMLARLVMVVAISGWRAARYPENAPYLLRNNAVSWTRLAACERIGHQAGTLALRQACGLD